VFTWIRVFTPICSSQVSSAEARTTRKTIIVNDKGTRAGRARRLSCRNTNYKLDTKSEKQGNVCIIIESPKIFKDSEQHKKSRRFTISKKL
jgi:hypothetical protein